MKLEDIKKIAVVGAGDMGHGIAEVALLAGYKVALRDVEQRFVDKGLQRIGESLARLARKKRVSEEDRREMMGKIETFIDLGEAVKDADFVIEAVPEVMDIKKRVFLELDKLAPNDALLASNSSNMSITEIASVTSRPEKVVGMHFFNPAVVMKLVEVIKGDETSEETMQLTLDLATRMNKLPVRVEKDSVGFIYNRIGAPGLILLGAIVDRGIATPEEIDARLKHMGMPMGPYELMDYVGLDIVYHSSLYVAERLSAEYGPPEWLQEKIEAGDLGKKTGKGIYDWSRGRPAIDLSRAKEDFDPTDLIAIQVNEATKLLEEGVTKNPDDIDKVMIHGGRAAFGPFQLARGIGYDKLARRCEELAREYGVEAFRPTETLKKGNI
ncbi:MAG: 3-hydroxyacyl-CoA dehydrogenase NAD-binding domain-containing protein [Dehalococcoidia bacterium]|nr:3-hydroxybutyryl-CoA dehydrogenase [Chloroflexota bacterium]MBT9162531.1 3-hydroxybutyryl-CoA dehydrogenase [Chloroflexota bacterium]